MIYVIFPKPSKAEPAAAISATLSSLHRFEEERGVHLRSMTAAPVMRVEGMHVRRSYFLDTAPPGTHPIRSTPTYFLTRTPMDLMWDLCTADVRSYPAEHDCLKSNSTVYADSSPPLISTIPQQTTSPPNEPLGTATTMEEEKAVHAAEMLSSSSDQGIYLCLSKRCMTGVCMLFRSQSRVLLNATLYDRNNMQSEKYRLNLFDLSTSEVEARVISAKEHAFSLSTFLCLRRVCDVLTLAAAKPLPTCLPTRSRS